MKRTDIHRPSAIQPEDYDFVAFECVRIDGLGDCQFLMAERERIQEHMKQTGGTYSGHEHGGNCSVCGAAAVYTILFHHRPTNTYIRTGGDCAEKMHMSYGDFNRFRAAIADATEAHAGKRKAQAVLAEAGLAACWPMFVNCGAKFEHPEYTLDAEDGLCGRTDGHRCTEAEQEAYYAARRAFDMAHKEELTINDIVGKLVKYGSISEKATNFLRTLLDRIATRAERAAANEIARQAAADCPAGRMQIEGVVLGIRTENTEWGPATKILVQADSGYKVWGSRFACAEKGNRVRFKATVKPSDRDAKFGFFSRPAKGEVIAA